jgi:hypothetical protein
MKIRFPFFDSVTPEHAGARLLFCSQNVGVYWNDKRWGNISIILMAFLFTHTAVAQEQDVVEMSATVTGNQEQPKVIYIVPWKAADDDSILYQPLNSQTDNIFGHVERSEHKRQLKFIQDMEEENTSE